LEAKRAGDDVNPVFRTVVNGLKRALRTKWSRRRRNRSVIPGACDCTLQ